METKGGHGPSFVRIRLAGTTLPHWNLRPHHRPWTSAPSRIGQPAHRQSVWFMQNSLMPPHNGAWHRERGSKRQKAPMLLNLPLTTVSTPSATQLETGSQSARQCQSMAISLRRLVAKWPLKHCQRKPLCLNTFGNRAGNEPCRWKHCGTGCEKNIQDWRMSNWRINFKICVDI